jgi:hypothetical protein
LLASLLEFGLRPAQQVKPLLLVHVDMIAYLRRRRAAAAHPSLEG